MRHYEILLMIHPDQSSQINAMIDRYTAIVIKSGGKIHRQEDWGKLQLAYQINKIHKANYVLLNIECSPAIISELHNAFKFNDAIIRNLITNCEHAITEPWCATRSRLTNADSQELPMVSVPMKKSQVSRYPIPCS